MPDDLDDDLPSPVIKTLMTSLAGDDRSAFEAGLENPAGAGFI